MRLIGLLVVLGMVVSSVYAQEEVQLALSLKDISGDAVSKVFVEVVIKNVDTDEERKLAQYQEGSKVNVILVQGSYTFELKIDDFATDGKDLYGVWEARIDEDTEHEVIVFPVGTIRGTVIDEFDNLVRNADLKFDCAKEYGEAFPVKADKYGYFNADYVPTGTCKVIASTSDARGIENVVVKQGEVTEVVVHIDKAEREEQRILGFLLAIGVIIVIGGVWVVKKRKDKKKAPLGKEAEEKRQEPVEVKEEGKKQLQKRTEDIMKTLNPKEKKVVEFLLENEGKSSQAKIRFGTGIPKTSLARVLESLRAKKIITIEQMMKLKKIELTGWFLGKDNE